MDLVRVTELIEAFSKIKKTRFINPPERGRNHKSEYRQNYSSKDWEEQVRTCDSSAHRAVPRQISSKERAETREQRKKAGRGQRAAASPGSRKNAG
jgi:hypothetical protein